MNLKKDKKAIIAVGFLITISSLVFIVKSLSPDAFIGHADEANLGNLAQNIARGNGPLLDIAWIHTDGGIADGKLPAPEPYFGLYPGFIIAPFFKIFGETRLGLIIPPLILQALIVIISSKIIYKIYDKKIRPTILIASTLLLSKQIIFGINGLTDIYMAACTLSSIAILSKGILKENMKMIGAGGFLSGLAIGMKLSGAFSFLSITGLIFLYISRYISIKKLLSYTLVFSATCLIAATPYFTYNFNNFNSIIPAGYQKVGEARLVRQNIACNKLAIEGIKYNSDCHSYNFDELHDYSTYNPKAKFTGEKKKAYIKLIFSNLKEFLYEFKQNKILPLYLLPFAIGGSLLAFKRIYHLKKNPKYLSYQTIFIICSTPVVLIGSIAIGLLSQSQERYWLFTYPLILIASYYWLSKYLKANLSFNIIILFLTFLNLPHSFLIKPQPDKTFAYEKVKNIIPENAIVLNSNPWQFAFHTNRKSVAVPFTSNLEIIRNVATKYDASYLVIVDGDIRNEKLNTLLVNKNFNFLKKKFSSKDLIIYSLDFSE
tara:strand:+ start:137 stop:1768 length:1632 start_codon:yes stop_codon:yes gene_type:complete